MEDDIAKVLGGLGTNQHGPSPSRARVSNSPLAGAMYFLNHAQNVGLSCAPVKPRVGVLVGCEIVGLSREALERNDPQP
jgi:hypothetical protein